MVLSFTTLPSIATTIPKTGVKCAKSGTTVIYKGFKYVCKSVNKKLVWSVGTPVKSSSTAPSTKPSPTNSSLPSASTSPLPFGIVDKFGRETSKEALIIDKLLEEAWAKGKPAAQWIYTDVHPKVEGKRWAVDATNIFPAITQVLDGIGVPITRKLDWFVWWDLDTLRPKLPDNCWAKSDTGFDKKSVGAGYCIPSSIFIFYEAYQQWYPKEGFLDKYPNEWDKYGIIAVAAGEVAHFAQQLHGEKYGHSLNFYPAWLREGPTAFYSAMAYAKYTGLPYSTVRNLVLKHFNRPCKNVLMSDLLMTGTSNSLCEYSGGLLAVEYLAATTGDLGAPFRYMESKMTGNGPYCESTGGICKNAYEDVIREIYSKDVDGWHQNIQAYVKRWAF